MAKIALPCLFTAVHCLRILLLEIIWLLYFADHISLIFGFAFWNSAKVSSLLMCTFLHLLHLLNRFPAVHQSPQSRIFCIIFVSCPFFVQIKRCRSHKCFSSKGMWHILFSFTKNVFNFTKNPSYYLQILPNFYCIFNFLLI